MDRQQIEAQAQAFIDALHTLEEGDEHATDAIVGLFSEEARLINAALKLSHQERRGRDGAQEFWREYRRTFGTARSEFSNVTVSDDAAGLFWTTKGTGSDQQPIEYDGASLLHFDDQGKIVLFRGYYDTREIGRVVGK